MFFGITSVELSEDDELFGAKMIAKLSPVWPLLARRYPQLTVVSASGLNIGVEGVTEDIQSPLNEDFALAYKLSAVDVMSDEPE